MPLVARSTPPATGPVVQRLVGRRTDLAGIEIVRLLPHRERRCIGPWCFVDHAEPAGTRLAVGEHPHIGLQTVTWLFQGSLRHRDSLGNDQVVRPGQLNWMTAGRGIAHAEDGLDHALHLVQMWVALPARDRDCAPAFDHHPELPVHEADGWRATVLAGTLCGSSSPARTFSPLVGAELAFAHSTSASVPVRDDFEHGLILVAGRARLDGVELARDALLHLGMQRSDVRLEAEANTRVLLLGGAPFREPILMWWNFVARTEQEIVQARAAWRNREFAPIPGFGGEWVDAPSV